MNLNLIDLHSALVVAPVSMAKIEGQQSAREILRLFTDILIPHAPRDGGSTDAAIVTTEGLYMNDTGDAFALRQSLWEKGDRFRRQFDSGIRDAQKKDPIILPLAYEITSFDQHRVGVHEAYRSLAGFLLNQYHSNPVFEEIIASDLRAMNQPKRKDKIYFLVEEFAWGWLVFQKAIQLRTRNPLRKHDRGQVIMCYPGGMMKSWTAAFRLLSDATRPLPKGKCLWVDTLAGADEDVAQSLQRAPVDLVKKPLSKLKGFSWC